MKPDPRVNFKTRLPSPHRGYFFIDSLIGLCIVSTVTVALLSTVRHEQHAERRLGASRDALHLAEHALLNLQHHQPLPPVTRASRISLQPTATGTAPAGYLWVNIEAAVDAERQSLIGIVPADSPGMPASGPGASSPDTRPAP